MKTIVKHYAGSIAYGTNLPTSDTDFRGIFCAPKERIVTPFQPIRELTIEDEEDSKLYELTNFMKLYLDGNPNILETLWVDQDDVTIDSDVYWYLCENAHALLSKKVRWTFSGYAFSQLKRIKGHNKWINKPQPEEPPKQKEFLKLVQNFRDEQIFAKNWSAEDWDNYMLVPYGNHIYGMIPSEGSSAINRDGSIKKFQYDLMPDDLKKEKPEFIVKYCEDEYKKALEVHKNYWGWVKNRNVKRNELEEKFGYDTKHAMHLVRLLRMGEEILRGDGVIVKRPDAQELLDIRNGAWKYEELIQYAEDAEKRMDDLYKTSRLPKAPRIDKATHVLMKAQEMCW